ncbi:MAG: MATE family efflux transporter [Micropruina sp.]|uniref:MATE family efflux transporter n=1 Tax=Micropruina sp. TaxID=2737536 RepID=UPI0039E5E409
MSADGEVAEAATTYFHWRIWSAPFVLFNFVVFGWIIGRGEAIVRHGASDPAECAERRARLALGHRARLGGGGCRHRLAGCRRRNRAGRPLSHPRHAPSALWSLPDIAAFRRAFMVNGDMMIRSFALLIGLSFFTRQSGMLGIDILAANTILLRFYFFGVAFIDGVATAAEQLAGRAVGARFRPAFDRTIKLTTLWGFVFAALVSLAFLVSGGWVIALTAPTENVTAMAHAYLPYVVALPVFGIVAFQMDGVYIGATWSRQMRNLMVGVARHLFRRLGGPAASLRQ